MIRKAYISAMHIHVNFCHVTTNSLSDLHTQSLDQTDEIMQIIFLSSMKQK